MVRESENGQDVREADEWGLETARGDQWFANLKGIEPARSSLSLGLWRKRKIQEDDLMGYLGEDRGIMKL